MKIFADTGNLSELKELIGLGVVDGITTNPKILSKEGGIDAKSHLRKILSLQNGPVSLEVTTNDYQLMIKQARTLRKLGKNVVVKIPMNYEGIKAVARLSRDNIKINVTACMSTKQAVIAAKAGAKYISLFWGRIADMGYDVEREVKECIEIFNTQNFDAEIIVGSLRQMSQILSAIRAGAHILTIPTQLIKDMIYHPRTETTIQEFLEAWESSSLEF